jgi:hypothetical protein
MLHIFIPSQSLQFVFLFVAGKRNSSERIALASAEARKSSRVQQMRNSVQRYDNNATV